MIYERSGSPSLWFKEMRGCQLAQLSQHSASRSHNPNCTELTPGPLGGDIATLCRATLWKGRSCGRRQLQNLMLQSAPQCSTTQTALSRESPLSPGQQGTWQTEQALKANALMLAPPPKGCSQDIRCATVSRSLYLGVIVLTKVAEV